MQSPAPPRAYTDKRESVSVEATNVNAAFVATHPA
jgi:hypothetical protein